MGSELREKLSELFPDEAKKITEEEIKAEKEKKERDRKEQDERLEKRRKEHIENDKYKSFIDTYINPMLINNKKKSFLYHLLISYVPHTKLIAYHLYNAGKQGKCCFCKTKIMNFAEIHYASSDFAVEKAKLYIKYRDKTITENDYLIRMKRLNDKIVIGWTSPDTNTVICHKCMIQFERWIETSILWGEPIVVSAIKKSTYKNIKDGA